MRGRSRPGGVGAKRYTSVSEVGTYVFCARALAFQREGAPSARGPERAAGTQYHQAHGDRAAMSGRASKAAGALLTAATILLALGIWTFFR